MRQQALGIKCITNYSFDYHNRIIGLYALVKPNCCLKSKHFPPSLPTNQSTLCLTRPEIQRRMGVSQPTIRKYLAMDDFSPKMPAKPRRGSMLDPYKPFIDSILEDGRHVWRKQRHTARRIYERLLDETPYAGDYGIVMKYVRERKAQMKALKTAFIELVWAPGEAQADFGRTTSLVHRIGLRLAAIAILGTRIRVECAA